MEQVLWRLCCGVCGREFLACAPCARVRKYCSSDCAQQAERDAQRRARRKHQATDEGRLDHRDHQRAYREHQRSGVMDGPVGKLAETGSLHGDDARADHGHDQGEQRGNSAARETGTRRADDCTARAWLLRAQAGASRADGGPGAVVSEPDLRCSVCANRGSRIVDRPRRWPWLRPGHASLRGRRVAARSPPRRCSVTRPRRLS